MVLNTVYQLLDVFFPILFFSSFFSLYSMSNLEPSSSVNDYGHSSFLISRSQPGSSGEGGPVGLQVKACEFLSLLCHYLATWPEPKHVTPLCLSFFIFKVRVLKLFLQPLGSHPKFYLRVGCPSLLYVCLLLDWEPPVGRSTFSFFKPVCLMISTMPSGRSKSICWLSGI